MNTLRRVIAFSSAVAGLSALAVILAAPASASCAAPPQDSPHAFVGRVIATESDDRVASVRTTGGETVLVVGTPAPGEHSFTSVDRTYVVGGAYEFHPVNAAAPYEDNACTATERLRGDDIPVSLRDGATSAQALVGSPDQTGQTAAVAAVAGVAAVGGAGLWFGRRKVRATR